MKVERLPASRLGSYFADRRQPDESFPMRLTAMVSANAMSDEMVMAEFRPVRGCRGSTALPNENTSSIPTPLVFPSTFSISYNRVARTPGDYLMTHQQPLHHCQQGTLMHIDL